MGSGYRTFTAGEVLTASNVQDYLMDQSVMVFADSTARATNIGTANFEEGMVSYLEDSDTVEVYDGSAWASIAPASTSGLTLINTTSFSAVSAQSLPTNTFTASYKNYLILIDVTTSASTQLNLRYRAAGVDATGSNYSNQWLRGVSTTASAASSGPNAFNDLETNAATRHLSELYLFQPQLAVATAYTNKFLGGSGAIGMIGGLHSLTTAYDSATFYPTTGTMTGDIYTYGVNF